MNTVELKKQKEKPGASTVSKPKRRAVSSFKIEENNHMKIKAITRRQEERDEAKKK